MSYESDRKTVVVAGASGFVGSSLPAVLGDHLDLIGLSRRPRQAGQRAGRGYRWRRCDLFSGRQTREALEGADCAVYLVHSMLPSAKLSQAEVGDLDLICADNFARACAHHGVEHIIHLSELSGVGEQTRMRPAGEVERVLGAYGAAVTTLRAGFIIGPGGAATRMLTGLVDRLAVMLLPKWTSSKLAPIARRDVVELIDLAIESGVEVEGSWDIGGPETTTYRGMLAMVAELKGLDRRFVRVPVATPRLSAVWVSSVTGQPRDVVEPLVRRFQTDLMPADRRLQQRVGQEPMSVRRALSEALSSPAPTDRGGPPAISKQWSGPEEIERQNLVRSVQRLRLPTGRTTSWVAGEYAHWLSDFSGPLMRATVDEGIVRFFLWRLPWPLLILELDESSRVDRQLFWIRGGLLAAHNPEARLEFRRVPGQPSVLAAIHHYRPRLPWLIYLVTQAKFHQFVMDTFGDYLRRVDEEISRSPMKGRIGSSNPSDHDEDDDDKPQ